MVSTVRAERKALFLNQRPTAALWQWGPVGRNQNQNHNCLADLDSPKKEKIKIPAYHRPKTPADTAALGNLNGAAKKIWAGTCCPQCTEAPSPGCRGDVRLPRVLRCLGGPLPPRYSPRSLSGWLNADNHPVAGPEQRFEALPPGGTARCHGATLPRRFVPLGGILASLQNPGFDPFARASLAQRPAGLQLPTSR